MRKRSRHIYTNERLIAYIQSNVRIKHELSQSPSPLSDGSSTKSVKRTSTPDRKGGSSTTKPKTVDEILSSLDEKDLILSSNHPYKSHSATTLEVIKQEHNGKSIYVNPTVLNSKSSYSPIVYNGVQLYTNDSDADLEGVDLYAWQLRATHYPLFKKLQTARKTLTTHDWKLAREELKSLKSIQKIEALKKRNMWSPKQLRKHKSVPRLKTHWDCLIDEMKWMQTDFKEERKWKVAMAYVLSRAVLEWHSVKDKSTVCVRRRIPTPIAIDSPMLVTEPNLIEDEPMTDADVDHPLKSDPMMGVNEEQLEPSLPTTPKESSPVATLSNHIIQEYRNIIKNMDPNIPILSFSDDRMSEFDATALFPDLLTYEPPQPHYNDLYLNELEFAKVTPISKLLTQQVTLKTPQRYSHKRDIDGNLINYPENTDNLKNQIKPLPRLERYDSTNHISRKTPFLSLSSFYILIKSLL